MPRSRIVPLSCFISGAIFAQTALQLPPIPSDPLELATGAIQIADTSDKRAAILTLLERARQNNNLHAPGAAPYDLKVSFQTSGSAYSGAGSIEELWASGRKWRWTARLGDYSQTRIFYNGAAYDSNPHVYMPLRMHMVRHAIFWPVTSGAANAIRITQASWRGAQVTCALISRGAPATGAGRQWREEEICVDPANGLLQTYSEAPGIYAAYDYTNAQQFHGSTLARQIAIVENGATVERIQIENMRDLGATSASDFTPTADMQPPGAMIQTGVRFPLFVRGNPAAGAGGAIEPVIVHAALDVNGAVLEAEALQTSNAALTQAALENVKNRTFGASRGQREVFINVQFAAAQ
jgi:hypothetical protein